jgi:hypothetical protein
MVQKWRAMAALKLGTLSEHPARILHVLTFHVHAVFCRDLPFGVFAPLQKCL